MPQVGGGLCPREPGELWAPRPCFFSGRHRRTKAGRPGPPSSEARPHISEGLAQEASCVPRELPPLTPKAATGPQRPAPGVWVSAARYVQISSRIALLA